MEFQFEDVKQGFASPDFLYNFEPAGDLAPKYNPPPAPNSVENLTFDYIQKQRQVNDAVQQQHRIDNLYERVMNEAPRRDIEVLPPEDPADVFNPNKTRLKNITPVEQQQEITELLERQVKRPTTPPVAEPPVTPNYKTIPLTDPLATPPTFTPRQPVGGPNPAPGAKPSGLPFPGGKFAVPVAGAAADFAFRVVAGQPPAQAAAGAAGSAVGGVVGGAIGSAVGPVGSFVGGVIGGFVGGAIADLIYKQAFPPEAYPPPEPYFAPPPFNGGQCHIGYAWNFSTAANPRNNLSDLVFGAEGPITNFRVLGLINTDVINNQKYGNWAAAFESNGVTVQGSAVGFYPGDLPTLVVMPANGGIDACGNPPAPAPPPDSRPYPYQHPDETKFAPPRGKPAPAPPPTDYAPGNTTPKGTPRGDGTNWVPHGNPAPRKNPNPFPVPPPNTAPTPQPRPYPFPNPLPTPSPNPAPNPAPNPNNPPNFRTDGGPSPTPRGPGASGSPSPIPPPSGIPTPTPTPSPNPNPSPTPNPNPSPTPTTPPTNICESPCIQSMGKQLDKVKSASIFWIDLQVPVVACEQDENGVWTPKRQNQTVKVIATSEGNEITKTQAQFEEIAKANEELCRQKNPNPSEEAYLVTPEWWQVRAFQKPQLVIQYAELLNGNKIGRSRWAVTIPHYNKPKDYKPKFPQYEKGNFEGILVLKDNSKIIINAKTKTECTRVLESFKIFVDPVYTKDIQLPKVGERPGVYKEISVVPVYAHFFKDGQKDNVPTWSMKLRDKK